MASTHKSLRLPTDVWEAFQHLYEQEDGPFSEYDSANAAGVGLFLWAVTFSQRKHLLCAAVSKLKDRDRDLIHAFVNYAAKTGLHLGDMMPKPATAADLLALAKKWRHGDGFRDPSGE
jgi:hypothetical protein